MARVARALLALCALAGVVAMLAPHELRAERTVGDQGRALRLRRIDAPVEPHGPRLCVPGEIPSDRDPCTIASSRAAFSR